MEKNRQYRPKLYCIIYCNSAHFLETSRSLQNWEVFFLSRIEVALFLLTKMDTILSIYTGLNRPLSKITKGATS
jgi:hypothetical protein